MCVYVERATKREILGLLLVDILIIIVTLALLVVSFYLPIILYSLLDSRYT